MFYKCPMLGSQKLALETCLNHAALIKSLNRCCFSGWRGNAHAMTLGKSNCTVFWMCIFTIWNVFIIHLGRKVGRGVVLPSPPVRKLRSCTLYLWSAAPKQWCEHRSCFSCQTLRGGDATLVNHLGLAQGDCIWKNCSVFSGVQQSVQQGKQNSVVWLFQQRWRNFIDSSVIF